MQRILKVFENEQQIAQQTSSRNRLITIKNWTKYQPFAQQNVHQLHNSCTTTAHIQECNNVIYINLFNRYGGEKIKTFKDKMNFMHNVKEDADYTKLSEREQKEFTSLILGGT